METHDCGDESMFIAKHTNNTVVTGVDWENHVKKNGALKPRLSCPICAKPVEKSGSVNRVVDYFSHADGTLDCFAIESASDSHRLGVELTVKALYNRVREIFGLPVEIDVERRVGDQSNFVIADIRMSSPFQIVAEVYYKKAHLELVRRLQTLFANNYQAFIIFHTEGRHDVEQVEQEIQRIAPLQVGRFDPDSLEVSLGDLFSREHVPVSPAVRDLLPIHIR